MPVLVVDDNATNRRILQEMLQNWRMLPTVVDCGSAAIARLKQASDAGAPFRLVLLDGRMPDMDGFRVAEEIQHHPRYVRSAIMMLSSTGHTGAMNRCRELGITDYLTKPVKQSDLLNAVLHAVGRQVTESGVGESEIAAVQPVAKPLDILVAEDNVVNQRLAMHLLEKRGHRVRIAVNGREALNALKEQPADIVLMDVQMPDMDGFEATAAIREWDHDQGRHTTIVAMTAHAMTGDRARCIDAGMDGYISKPLRISELLDEIHRVLAAAQ